MPISTSSYLDAIDRQESITTCLSSVIDLIASAKNFEYVSRADFSYLLFFLKAELLNDESWRALRQANSDRQDLFVSCYGAIDDLSNPSDNLQGVDRDHLFFILNFLHEELIQVNQILDCLNNASNNKLDHPQVNLPFVKPEPAYKQHASRSAAVGE